MKTYTLNKEFENAADLNEYLKTLEDGDGIMRYNGEVVLMTAAYADPANSDKEILKEITTC